MSLAAQYTALYRMFYKGAIVPPELDRARLDAVVRLHAADIGHQWYKPRVPASWLALQVATGLDERELVRRFTRSDAFELRIDDDADGCALTEWVRQLDEAGELAEAPWLPDLLRYELLLGARWQDNNPRVEEFAWDVGGIHESLLADNLFPTDERPRRRAALFHHGKSGITEVPLTRDQAAVMGKLLTGQDAGSAKPALVKHCQSLLRKIGRRSAGASR